MHAYIHMNMCLQDAVLHGKNKMAKLKPTINLFIFDYIRADWTLLMLLLPPYLDKLRIILFLQGTWLLLWAYNNSNIV